MIDRAQENHLKKAALIAWVVLSACMALAVASSFLVSAETFGRVLPDCEMKTRYGRECPFCGMTRSFIYVSQGELDKATKSNGAGPYLYAAFVLNAIACSAAGGAKLKCVMNNSRQGGST